MRADTKYIFIRKTALITSWILEERHGAAYPGFINCYDRIPRNQWGSYAELLHKNHINLKELRGGKFLFRCKEHSFIFSFRGDGLQGAGCRNLIAMQDAILIRRSTDWNVLTVYVFFNRGQDAGKLLDRWRGGEKIELRGGR